MNRKNFIKTASLSAVAAAFPLPAFAKSFSPAADIIKPPKLKQGDTLALISPAGFIDQEQLDESKENLEKLGFKVVAGKNVLGKYGYLGGLDKERADDVNWAFSDKSIDGIVCTRGGYGCARILHLLDYNTIKNNPKVIIGYSDITSLLYGIFSQTGLVCFHGPVGTSTYNPFSVNNFFNALTKPDFPIPLYNAIEESDSPDYKVSVIRSGKCTGQLVGGNLSIVVSLIGTKYDIDTRNKIIFLEEISEEPYRIDRMLTQMIQAGKFEKCSGVAIGVFYKCNPDEKRSGIGNSLGMMEVVQDRLFPLGIPVIYGLSFGHIINKFTLPFGINAELNVSDTSFTLLENCVV